MGSRRQFWTGFAVAAMLASSASLAKADNFGAIAYSASTGAYGFSYDFESREEAEREAMLNCYAEATGCEVVVWFKNSCGALAAGNDSGWGSAWADSRSEAENAAEQYCRDSTTNCRVIAYSCTSR